MLRSKQDVFNELYELFEAGTIVSVKLQEEARKHGIRISAVEDAAIASREVDFDDE